MAASSSSSHPPPSSSLETEDDGSDSELFAELEAELDEEDQLAGFDMGEYRQKRMEEMKKELAERPPPSSTAEPGVAGGLDLGISSSQIGKYIQLQSEKEVISLLEKAGRRVVLHFSHKEFKRCILMDRHLEALALLHPTTLFLSIAPTNAPFLVHKLDIKVLPCVVCFVDGKAKDKMVGFEELGNTDTFRRDLLEDRLGASGVITPRSKSNLQKPIFGFTQPATENQDASDDWD